MASAEDYDGWQDTTVIMEAMDSNNDYNNNGDETDNINNDDHNGKDRRQ